MWVSLSPAEDILISLGRTAEVITASSKRVMTTMGEWELLDITAHKRNFDQPTSEYIDKLIFHVS